MKLPITKHQKALIIILILIIGIVAVLQFNKLHSQVDLKNQQSNITYGLSFSPRYAQSLGLDPQKTYQQILDDLNPKKVRLAAYWDQIEPTPDQYDFTELDYYLKLSSQKQVKVLLAVGYKLPRWPECYAPAWIDQSDIKYRQERQLKMIKTVIERYKNHPTVEAWQVENELQFPFGICPPPDQEFIQKEVELVRSLSDKKIVMTDSGEFSTWITTMKTSDILGSTLYRTAYFPAFGHLSFPFKTWYYRIRSDIARQFFAPNNQKTIISELQAETWSDRPTVETPIDVQIKYFPLKQFQQNLEFAQKTGFDEIYIWGVEWWYYMQSHSHPEYLDNAKLIFSGHL